MDVMTIVSGILNYEQTEQIYVLQSALLFKQWDPQTI